MTETVSAADPTRALADLRARLDALGPEVDIAKARLTALRRACDEAAASLRLLSAALVDARNGMDARERRSGG